MSLSTRLALGALVLAGVLAAGDDAPPLAVIAISVPLIGLLQARRGWTTFLRLKRVARRLRGSQTLMQGAREMLDLVISPLRREYRSGAMARCGFAALLLAMVFVPVATPWFMRQVVQVALDVEEWRFDWPAQKQIDALATERASLDPTHSPRVVEYRDLGFQVLRSRAAVAHASCGFSSAFRFWPLSAELLQASHWLCVNVNSAASARGAAAAQQPKCAPERLTAPVRPHCVPVVQFDFSATYLLARHGQGAGLLLIGLQATFAALCLAAFVRLQTRTTQSVGEAAVYQAMSLMALGAGALHVAQWGLSWSNTFGLFPVMGQPMTWLSAAGSHHLFAAIPAIFCLIVALRISDVYEPELPYRHPPMF
jgi:hypothetical protein